MSTFSISIWSPFGSLIFCAKKLPNPVTSFLFVRNPEKDQVSYLKAHWNMKYLPYFRSSSSFHTLMVWQLLNLQVIVFIYMTTATLGHNLKMISHQKKMPTFLKSGVPFNCRCSVKICWSYDVHTTHHVTPSTWKRQRDLKPELMKFLLWLIWFFKLSKTWCQQISSTWGRSLSLSLKWVGMLHFLFRESAGPKNQKRRLVVV